MNETLESPAGVWYESPEVPVEPDLPLGAGNTEDWT